MKLCDRSQLELYAIASPTKINDSCPSARIEFPDFPLSAQSASRRTPSALATVAKSEIDDSYEYLAYFAITAAVGEYASGNYENAIQLLDREIERQQATPAFAGTIPPGPQSCAGKEGADADACSQNNRKRLYWFRRLFVISRLEWVENYLFQYSEAPATYPVQVVTLLRMIRHYDAMFERLEADAITNREMFVGALAANPGAKCASSLSGDPDSMRALAMIAYSRIAAENSLVFVAATNPEIVLANTDRINEFDRYADEVADFDADCLPKMMVTNLEPLELRWRNLDTAAAYWEAKGRRFGVRIDDEQTRSGINSSDTVEIRAMCKAAKANSLAQRAARLYREKAANSPSPDDETLLDRSGASYFRDAYVARLERAPARINAALRGYPQGEIDAEKECAEAPLQR
jgi:hypothetical protein